MILSLFMDKLGIPVVPMILMILSIVVLVAGFAFIFINMYNGQRGFVRSKALKYFFYLFYPLHLFILALLRYWIFGIAVQ